MWRMGDEGERAAGGSPVWGMVSDTTGVQDGDDQTGARMFQ